MRLIPSWMRRRRRESAGPESEDSITGIRTSTYGDAEMLTVDLDSFSHRDAPQIHDEIIRRTGFPLFEGTVEHGYSKRAVGSTDKCPRCEAATKRQIANFIYATHISPRAMLAPAGYFCSACPTVIVDEDLITAGMKEGYRFRCVVGVDYPGKKEPDYFRTWNGKESIYVLDENQQIMDLATSDPLQRQASTRARDRRKEKRRRKMAQQSRRRNRK
jgi:hypothetical protein